MKRFITLTTLCLVYSLQTFAQASYDKLNGIFWEKDSLCVFSKDSDYVSPVDPKCFNLEINIIGQYSASISIKNNSDKAIDVDWSFISYTCNGKWDALKLNKQIDYSKKEQIQHLAKKGFAIQMVRQQYQLLLPTKELKKAYKKNKRPVDVDVELLVNIIYNEETVLLKLYKHGRYDPQQ